MRLLLIFVVLSAVACSKQSDDSNVTCAQAEDADWVLFPDNVGRRVTVDVCTNGCSIFTTTEAPFTSVNSCTMARTCYWDTSAPMVPFPDGVTYKSDVYRCTDGCLKYISVDDKNNTHEVCQ
jgi:hypothetical protein